VNLFSGKIVFIMTLPVQSRPRVEMVPHHKARWQTFLSDALSTNPDSFVSLRSEAARSSLLARLTQVLFGADSWKHVAFLLLPPKTMPNSMRISMGFMHILRGLPKVGIAVLAGRAAGYHYNEWKQLYK
jgi:hypothetical protein